MTASGNSSEALASVREATEHEGEGEPSAFLSAQSGLGQQRNGLQPEDIEAQQRAGSQRILEEFARFQQFQRLSARQPLGLNDGQALEGDGGGDHRPYTPDQSLLDAQDQAQFGFGLDASALDALIRRASALAGTLDADAARDPSGNNLSKKWAAELLSADKALKWGHLQIASVNGLLGGLRALVNVFSTDFRQQGAEDYADEQARQGLGSLVCALELYQAALLFKDEESGRAFCESVQLERDEGTRPSFGNLPNICPVWEKKAGEIKAYNARTAFRKLQDAIATRQRGRRRHQSPAPRFGCVGHHREAGCSRPQVQNPCPRRAAVSDLRRESQSPPGRR
jgi:hypothetical protein